MGDGSMLVEGQVDGDATVNNTLPSRSRCNCTKRLDSPLLRAAKVPSANIVQSTAWLLFQHWCWLQPTLPALTKRNNNKCLKP